MCIRDRCEPLVLFYFYFTFILVLLQLCGPLKSDCHTRVERVRKQPCTDTKCRKGAIDNGKCKRQFSFFSFFIFDFSSAKLIEKWNVELYLPFPCVNEKWKMENRHPFFIFHFL